MGILTWLSDRTKRRRYSAALVIFSAAYGFRRLGPEEAGRVRDEANDILNGKYEKDGVYFPAASFWRFAGWHSVAALHAVAMARLGIPALVEWPRALARSTSPNLELGRLDLDFRALDPQTEAALQHLRILAPDIDSVLPSMLDDPSNDDADMYGPRRTVREALRNPGSSSSGEALEDRRDQSCPKERVP